MSQGIASLPVDRRTQPATHAFVCPTSPATHGRADWLPPESAHLAAFTHTRRRFPSIGTFLGAAGITALELSMLRRPDAVVAWGDGPPARLARRYAVARRLPFYALEDGFLRSVGLGKTRAVPVSMVVDDLGLHFDAGAPSRLERLLAEGCGQCEAARGRALRDLITRERLTKYNHLPDRPIALPRSARRRILLVDQVVGDRAIEAAGAGPHTFRAMCEAARAEPGVEIVVKSHPDVVAGVAAGHLNALAGNHVVIAEPVSPHAVLDVVDEVWTVSSQLGLDAALRGIPVRTYGVPCYAGWGFTDDRAMGDIATTALARRRAVSIDEFVAVAFGQYALYADPVSERRVDAEQAIARLIAWRRRALDLTGTYLCVGLSRHKRKVARLYLEGPWSRVKFAPRRPRAKQIDAADQIVVWGDGAKGPATVLATRHRPIMRVEDGFVRSTGLGSDKIPPASLCFDAEGMHFDATRPSRLERLLDSLAFDDALLERARRLRRNMVAQRITKYNVASDVQGPDYRRLADGRGIVVVAAQVPDDASLRHGLPLHAGNLDLLAAVRRMRPHAFIVYKDHPELVRGNRPGRTLSRCLMAHADLVVGNVAVDPLLQAADELHVATSQLGFEALLRGLRVVCHGVPFYAGWGLTDDLVPSPRPRRSLTIEALVAGALILYPRYVSWRTGLPCEIEDVLAEMGAAVADRGLPGRMGQDQTRPHLASERAGSPRSGDGSCR